MSDETDSHDEDGQGGGGLPASLLALQAVDTETDQLLHRRANSPRRTEFEQAAALLTAWERRRGALTAEIAGLDATITAEEAKGAELLAQRQRLEAQLKTVIAPREAEALMHEIATIETRRDELDVEELAALERQSALDDELVAHLAGEGAIRERTHTADEALAGEVAEIDTTVERLAAERDEIRADLPETVLAVYDRKRAALGVAVAQLVGRQCNGCHLELSAAEIDTVRDEARATGVTDCPECGRLLIVA